MGRRTGFGGFITAVARASARAAREAEAAQRRAIREHQRMIRAAERSSRMADRASAAAEREAKRRYAEDRVEEARDRTQEVEEFVELLEGVLQQTLVTNDKIDFDSLRVDESFPPFVPPSAHARPYSAPERQSYLDSVQIPGRFGKMFSWVRDRYARELREASSRYENALLQFERNESERKAAMERARAAHEAQRHEALTAANRRNTDVAEFELAYRNGDPSAIVSYITMVLERSDYLQEFPQQFRVAYSAESKEVIVDYQLPGVNIVPTATEFKYVKSRDMIEEKPRKRQEMASIYQDVVAAVTLRTLHEVFESDQGGHVAAVTFSGFVDAVDPATGTDIRPYLISVRSTRDEFEKIELSRVDKKVCLRNLGASVSSRPDELVAVKPIVEFNMVDRRFVEGSDILSELESRPNIMDLTPFEFENLVGNLFSKIGLETRQTQSSRDGGVDVVAFDTRPIFGGKVVIQAKRYRNTVGVAAVRDLYGTMMNEGANKGILVCTSGYGPDAFKFAKDKPIELIDGGQLLYLCEQNGIKARIVMPQDSNWR